MEESYSVDRTLRAAWLALLAVAISACGGDRRLERARAALERGQLERAEALVAGKSGPGQDHLRAKIADAKRGRAELEERIEDAFLRLKRGDSGAEQELEDLRDRAAGPWERERLALAASKAADLAAEVRRAKPLPKLVVPPVEAKPSAGEADGASQPQGDEFAERLAADVRRLMEQGQWLRAHSELERLRAGFSEPVPEFERAGEQLAEGMRLDALAVLERVRREESLRGERAARGYLEPEVARFPRLGTALAVHERWDSLGGSAAAPEVSPVASDPRKLALEASRLAGRGNLLLAGELWTAAALGSLGGDALSYGVRGRDASARAALRAALIDAQPRADLPGWGQTDLDGVVWEGRRRAWVDLHADQLSAMAEAAEQTDSEGLTGELLALLDGSGRKLASLRLQAATVAGRWSEAERDELVAWRLGDPSGTAYRFVEGEYRLLLDVESQALGEEYEADLRRLADGEGEERDAAWERVAALAEDSRAAAAGLRSALSERLTLTCGHLAERQEMGRLERLARARDSLDVLRNRAFELIEDEEAYFYPFAQHLVGGERNRVYTEVQREVDSLVERLDKHWNRSEPPVPLAPEFRGLVADLLWNVERLEGLRHPAPLGPGVPSWIEGIHPGAESVGLQEFAWSREERLELDLWDRIEAEIERRVQVHGGARDLDAAEQEQVRITNAYRQMLGRRPLAWNPALQGAAAKHSQYMADTGELGHIEDSPYPKPIDRMVSEGYRHGGGENCYSGGTKPSSAHRSWVRSSTHHRNLLDPRHTEIGAALRGAYWTQVYGTDEGWLLALE